MPKRQTQEEFIKKAKAIFGDQYDYSKVEYKTSRTPVVLICKKHGEFEVLPGAHLCYKTRCELCSGKKHNTATFIEQAQKIHGNKFIYNKVNYNGAKLKIIIICRIHGDFAQDASHHIDPDRKGGCPLCNKACKKSLEYFLSEAKNIHGNIYDYSKVKYKSMSKKVEIVCKKHGSFFPTPSIHINKTAHGCPECHTDSTRTTQEDFVQKCIDAHGNRFDYSKTRYKNAATKVKIVCRKHGEFSQLPYSHIGGCGGCPKCVGGSVSQKEIKWLDLIKVPKKYRSKIIYGNNRQYRVDALNPITNTIYEFYGDYWHGNPKVYDDSYINKHNKTKFSELYDKTVKRQRELEKLGYIVVYIWENDYDTIVKLSKKKNKRTKNKYKQEWINKEDKIDS